MERRFWMIVGWSFELSLLLSPVWAEKEIASPPPAPPLWTLTQQPTPRSTPTLKKSSRLKDRFQEDDEDLEQNSETTPTPQPTPAPRGPSPFSFEVGPLVSPIISGHITTTFDLGFGFAGKVNLKLDDRNSLGLSLDFQQYDLSLANYDSVYLQHFGHPLPSNIIVGGGYNFLPLMVSLRSTITTGPWKPFFLLGAGIGFNHYSVQSTLIGSNPISDAYNVGETDLLWSPGFGVEVAMGEVKGFLQVQMDMDFTRLDAQDVRTITSSSSPPQTSVGIISPDSPTLFLPIEAGVKF